MTTSVGSLALLDDVVGRLRSAGEQFDRGNLAAATALAGQIRETVRLIDELGLTGRLTWVDTAGVPNPKTQCATACLALTKVGNKSVGHCEYVPKMSLYPPAPIRTRDGGHIDRGSRIPFEHWWTNPVLRDVDGTEYSRRQLVLNMATRRGGADSSDPVPASIRQIAYEVLQSIAQQHTVIDDPAFRLAG
ncbi:hypothetical protein [Mycobacterium sp. SMC-4]|uniref:hypothetical protein n=1 Tax=Mycobacterium sp. SMC-4 TaxID=2857059 RepID=UPI0021B2B7FF|nr:hypothetical protein [Mycobacterium sp. SMC-4]UXA19328.1 hypothetical protein KXD98_06850 [Mycobacterium sp. SMC-4]